MSDFGLCLRILGETVFRDCSFMLQLTQLTRPQVPLNPAFNSPQVIAALSHLSASHLIISTETNLPFRDPKENITLLKQICPDLHAGKVQSPSVPSLRDIILVDNSAGRVDTERLRATVVFGELLDGMSGIKGRSVVPESELKVDDIINSESAVLYTRLCLLGRVFRKTFFR